MSRTSLVAAAAIIVVANTLALTHALRNRQGTEAQVTLTERELRYYSVSAGDEDSGVTLNLAWTDPNGTPWPVSAENPMIWLDQPKLQGLGFDCSVNPSSPDSARYYERQRARQVFVALEYDGAAWRAWAEAYQRALADQRAKTPYAINVGAGLSHLVAIDADLNSTRLRVRYPNRTTVIIVPAVIRLTIDRLPNVGVKGPARVIGRIQELPSSIHVPRPFSDEFRRLNPRPNSDRPYRVRLNYGVSLEPRVTGVEFLNGR